MPAETLGELRCPSEIRAGQQNRELILTRTAKEINSRQSVLGEACEVAKYGVATGLTEGDRRRVIYKEPKLV
jgi:hypothetical protein